MPPEPSHPYEILDVFTDTPLQGNPLAVFIEGEQIPSRLMQPTARELNLSETVFLFPGDHQADAAARIFTPLTELPFAGHPVLGAAFVVAEARGLEAVRLRTGSGVIPVRLTRDADGEIESGEMEQPLPEVASYAQTDELLAALGIARAVLPVARYSNGPTFVMVALQSREELRALKPDLRALEQLGPVGVSCVAGAGSYFHTRMFGPALGVPEDPATGSAAGPLALHLVRHGWAEYGEPVEFSQGSEIGRPSILHARVEGSVRGLTGIFVAGSAVRVASGLFRLQ